jgi:hypothetical protein
LRAPAYDERLYDLVRRIINEHKLDVSGKRVVLKPNLVEFDQNSVINTHPKLVHAALEAFRAAGASDVRIAEGPGHRRVTLDLAESAGYFATVQKFEDLFTDLNLDEITHVPLPKAQSKLESLYLPNTVADRGLLMTRARPGRGAPVRTLWIIAKVQPTANSASMEYTPMSNQRLRDGAGVRAALRLRLRPVGGSSV